MMSWFNKEMLCQECQDTESKHPKFQEAKETERQECLSGNLNFEGIGLPADIGKRQREKSDLFALNYSDYEGVK